MVGILKKVVSGGDGGEARRVKKVRFLDGVEEGDLGIDVKGDVDVDVVVDIVEDGRVVGEPF